jgi:hypothetical protein
MTPVEPVKLPPDPVTVVVLKPTLTDTVICPALLLELTTPVLKFPRVRESAWADTALTVSVAATASRESFERDISPPGWIRAKGLCGY